MVGSPSKLAKTGRPRVPVWLALQLCLLGAHAHASSAVHAFDRGRGSTRPGCNLTAPATPLIKLTGGTLLANVKTPVDIGACRELCCNYKSGQCTGWSFGPCSEGKSGPKEQNCCMLRAGAVVPAVAYSHHSGWVREALPSTFGPINKIGSLAPRQPQWSGYAKVSNDTSLFYHYVQSANKSAPLLLWTNGGPGATSVGYGDFFQLIGPFIVDEHSAVQHNPNSWADVFSLLFIDHPAPTGLSVSVNPPRTQEQNSIEYVAALHIIIDRHKAAVHNGLFLSGESYAGRFVPAIANEMMRQNVPLSGVLIGNGEVEPGAAFKSYGTWLFGLGYVSEGQRDELSALGANCLERTRRGDYTSQTSALCYSIREKASNWTAGAFWNYDVRYSAPDPFEPTERRTCQFLDLDATRRQMHAQPTSDISSILAGGKVAWAGFNHTNDFVRSGVPEVLNMLSNSVRVMIYTGQFDECMNVLSTANWMAGAGAWRVNSSYVINMTSFTDKPRVPYTMGGQTVGFTRRVAALSQFILLRAGHMCTLEQPNVSLQMFTDFVAGAI